MTTSDHGCRQTDLEAARTLLERLGITTEDLVAAPVDRPPMPTFAEYVPIVAATVTPGTLRTYGSYWDRIMARWGDRRLDDAQVAADTTEGRTSGSASTSTAPACTAGSPPPADTSRPAAWSGTAAVWPYKGSVKRKTLALVV
jgi:hypothetical protein